MCTMVYVPNDGAPVLASLRDESPQRSAANPPAIFDDGELRFIMPLDPHGGGSWVGVNERGSTIVLLNGAYEKHVPQPPYRTSRGLILRKLLGSEMPVVEWLLMSMDEIEPYTLVIFTDGKLFRLTWDGYQKHRQVLDVSVHHIFSSATLYDENARKARVDHFENWMVMRPPVTKLSLLNFFNSIQDKDNGFIIDRGGVVRSLSYSFISAGKYSPVFDHYDLRKYRSYSLGF